MQIHCMWNLTSVKNILRLGKIKELVYLLTLCIPVYAEVAIFNISSTELNKYSPVLTLKTNTMIYLPLNTFEKFKHKVVLKT